MAQQVTIKQVLQNITFYAQEILTGKSFAFYTDSILGLGANPQKDAYVSKIAKIKKRSPKKSFLVIPPSFNWVCKNCCILEGHQNFLREKYKQGVSSVILKIKSASLSNKVLLEKEGYKTVGLRFSNDNFTVQVLRKVKSPFISSSLNYSGEASIKSIENIPDKMLSQINYIISDKYNAPANKPSSIYDLTSGKIQQLR